MIGVISSHTEAPREFTERRGRLPRLERVARRRRDRERAPVRGDAAPGRRARARSPSSARRSPVPRRSTWLLPEVASRAREALRGGGLPSLPPRPRRREAPPALLGSRRRRAHAEITLPELGPELARSGRYASVAMPLVAERRAARAPAASGTSEVDLARAVANQTAVAIKKIELIERLTEKNLIKDFFEQLAAGTSLGDARGPRRTPRLRPRPAHLVAARGSPAHDGLETALGSRRPRARSSIGATIRCARCCASRPPARNSSSTAVRGSRRSSSPGLDRRLERLYRAPRASRPGSRRPATRSSAPRSCRERRASWPTRSSVRTSTCCVCRSTRMFATPTATRSRGSPSTTAQRSTALLRTLEEFLRRRGNISATAEALYVHPNTLRQRLRRIRELSGHRPPPRRLAMVEIAVKLVSSSRRSARPQMRHRRAVPSL